MAIGISTRLNVSKMPTISAPTSAPRTEPRPPITTTTSVGIRIGSPAPGSTDSSGPIMMPASAASMALSANTSV